MAHFAQLNEENKVINVIVVNNDVLLDENGIESEQKGIDFCKSLFGGNWIQTSYNKNFRGEFASMDYFYNVELGVFESPYPNPINVI